MAGKLSGRVPTTVSLDIRLCNLKRERQREGGPTFFFQRREVKHLTILEPSLKHGKAKSKKDEPNFVAHFFLCPLHSATEMTMS